MTYYWLLVTFSWFGTVSLQYINTGGPGAEAVLDPLDPTNFPVPNFSFLHTPRNIFERLQNEPAVTDNFHQFYQSENIPQESESQRKRRTIATDDSRETIQTHWLPNLVDTDQTMYAQNDERLIGAPLIIQGYTHKLDTNNTDINYGIGSVDKKSFSPWGGKREDPSVEQMWTWKRTAIKEPSMPKRVRFSPWGGKRSGQLIYKPGPKGTKLIYSSAIAPEVARMMSKYSKNGEKFNLAGIQFLPTMDKRHPIRILALSTKLGDRLIREAMPFNSFIDTVPKIYKPGHPYLDVNLKKDGKRKMKFSAWGGKRSPPVIGPIWTPSSQTIKDSTLDAILLIRNSPDDTPKLAKIV